MIHLHSMLSSESSTSTAGNNSSASLSQAKLASFHGELSDAVSSTLQKFGIHPKDVNISITRATSVPAAPVLTGSGAPTRVAPPTPGSPESNSTPSSTSNTSSTSTASTTPNSGYDPFLQAATNNPYQNAPLQGSTNSSTQSTAPVDAQQAFDDSYWASQPQPVQALRYMQNPGQREALATQLASQGYSIDVPIMVWGWDPSVVTSMRQADGYTWVPSAMQNPVAVAPGLPSMGSLTAYNPNNPPAGSIAV